MIHTNHSSKTAQKIILSMNFILKQVGKKSAWTGNCLSKVFFLVFLLIDVSVFSWFAATKKFLVATHKLDNQN